MREVWIVSKVGFEDFELLGAYSSEDLAKAAAKRDEPNLGFPYMQHDIEKLVVDAEP